MQGTFVRNFVPYLEKSNFGDKILTVRKVHLICKNAIRGQRPQVLRVVRSARREGGFSPCPRAQARAILPFRREQPPKARPSLPQGRLCNTKRGEKILNHADQENRRRHRIPRRSSSAGRPSPAFCRDGFLSCRSKMEEYSSATCSFLAGFDSERNDSPPVSKPESGQLLRRKSIPPSLRLSGHLFGNCLRCAPRSTIRQNNSHKSPKDHRRTNLLDPNASPMRRNRRHPRRLESRCDCHDQL